LKLLVDLGKRGGAGFQRLVFDQAKPWEKSVRFCIIGCSAGIR
jgi:hypothetical protein